MCIDSYIIKPKSTTDLEHLTPQTERLNVCLYNMSSFCVVSLLSLGFHLVVFKSLARWRLQPEGFRQHVRSLFLLMKGEAGLRTGGGQLARAHRTPHPGNVPSARQHGAQVAVQVLDRQNRSHELRMGPSRSVEVSPVRAQDLPYQARQRREQRDAEAEV